MMDEVHTKEVLSDTLRRLDPELTEIAANYVALDLLKTVDLTDPQIARHSLQWIAEHFYASYYLHAGWWY